MTQPDFFSEPVAPFAKGSHTSWKAAKSFTLSDRQRKTRTYLWLLSQYKDVTDPEAAFGCQYPRSSICSIRNAAERCGLVVKSGRERKSEFGKDCAAYRLTKAGRKVAETVAP